MTLLVYLIVQLCRRNRDGSFATQADRQKMLALFARQLDEAGYKRLKPSGLRSKHVDALLTRWRAEGISIGTTKNRLAALRWLCEKVGKPNLIPRDNTSLGINRRVHVSNADKSKSLEEVDVAAIRSPFVAAALPLQQLLGLRREESIKIRPELADRGDHLHLFASWTKGGRERDIPIRTAEQRAAIDHAKKVAGTAALIPHGVSYRKHLGLYKSECTRIGLGGGHGLRHAYAQARYRELTGRECPVKGGPRRRELSRDQRMGDDAARLTISAELGHARTQVVAIYIGG